MEEDVQNDREKINVTQKSIPPNQEAKKEYDVTDESLYNKNQFGIH